MITAAWLNTPDGLLRARGLGLEFEGEPGANNAITDVPGVLLGHSTIIEGEGEHRYLKGPIRTGVTVILPRGREGVGEACAAGLYSMNGNGEMTGSHWINESGSFSTPLGLTNTHAVGTVHRGIIDWIAQHRPSVAAQWQLPVVAETWDGFLNDINGVHVKGQHVLDAIDHATAGPCREGSVGGGTGMNCYGFKGGNGTASRKVRFGGEEYHVGVHLQCNFGGRGELTIKGVPVGRSIDAPCEIQSDAWFDEDAQVPPGAGSVIAIIATDAPLLPQQLEAMAKRVPLGLARTGTTGSHFSGDIFLAFSTANRGALNSRFPSTTHPTTALAELSFVPWGEIDPFYTATVCCVEEAVLNALFANQDMTGRNGHFSPALPHDQVVRLLGLR